jgi:hypothetical protein
VVAGQDNFGFSLANTEEYDSTTGSWSLTGSMIVGRQTAGAILLTNGEVLYAAGFSGNIGYVTNSEVYNPTTGLWASTGNVNYQRDVFTSTLLPNGKVLMVGGYGNGWVSNAELYDPVTGIWQITGALNDPRLDQSATLLSNGKVLIVGGDDPIGTTNTAELYDPVSGTFTPTGSMHVSRDSHTANLLANGKVLVAGGNAAVVGQTNSAELYDPSSGTWTITGSMNAARVGAVAILLPNGKVLMAGGVNNSGYLRSAELYDPAAGTWALTGSMTTNRYLPTASLLPNGEVLVAGGDSAYPVPLASTELYDPVTGTWTATGSMSDQRIGNIMTLLPNGKVLIAGGSDTNFGSTLSAAELYDVGLGFSAAWQPQITGVTSPVNLGTGLALSGSRFRGLSEASGGNIGQNSSSDHPVVQLHNLGNDQIVFLSSTNWSTNAYASLSVTNFPPGFALATVFANGIPGSAGILLITPAPTRILLTNPIVLPDRTFQFGFTNTPGAVFTALATTNLTSPSANWTTLGSATEISDGLFQFTDLQATNYPRRSYRIRSP